MTETTIDLPQIAETGQLGIAHLKRYWAKMLAKRNGALKQGVIEDEYSLDTALLAATGLGLEPTIIYLMNNIPTFDEFEQWVLEVNGGAINRDKINSFNKAVGIENTASHTDDIADVLTAEDLKFWDENGYVIVRNAVSAADCKAAVDAITEFIGVDLTNTETWYANREKRQGIMVPLYQHAALEKNRQSGGIRKAFEQLWGRKDILVNTDRAGFNPPEIGKYQFPGPYLHWDVSLAQPIPFGTQGILYLTDTAENQGAFTLVPGFQHRVGKWLEGLPQGANPRTENLYALGAKPIAANTGDFIIWQQALPHGSSPNTSDKPRIVQYINLQPMEVEIKKEWI